MEIKDLAEKYEHSSRRLEIVDEIDHCNPPILKQMEELNLGENDLLMIVTKLSFLLLLEIEEINDEELDFSTLNYDTFLKKVFFDIYGLIILKKMSLHEYVVNLKEYFNL